jgi:hypothetical protein
VVLREDEIRERVSLEGGEEGIGFANLRDLNNDGEVDDDTVREAYIDVENLYDDPEDPGPLTECSPFRMRYQRGENCFIRVTVRYDYDIFFPLAPALDDTITIRASFMMPIRSTFLG